MNFSFVRGWTRFSPHLSKASLYTFLAAGLILAGQNVSNAQTHYVSAGVGGDFTYLGSSYNILGDFYVKGVEPAMPFGKTIWSPQIRPIPFMDNYDDPSATEPIAVRLDGSIATSSALVFVRPYVVTWMSMQSPQTQYFDVMQFSMDPGMIKTKYGAGDGWEWYLNHSVFKLKVDPYGIAETFSSPGF